MMLVSFMSVPKVFQRFIALKSIVNICLILNAVKYQQTLYKQKLSGVFNHLEDYILGP